MGVNGLFGCLTADVVRIILLQLRGRDMVQLELVNRECADLAADDELWRGLVQRRWNVDGRASETMRRTKSTWRAVYANWDSVLRMPSSKFTGQRTAVFARAKEDDVAVWVSLKHTEDCRAERDGVRLRFVLQNLGSTAAFVQTNSCRLLLKSEARSKIRQLDVASNSLRCSTLLVQRQPGREGLADSSDLEAKPCAPVIKLETHAFAVLEVSFHLHSRRILHPEALERLSSISISIKRTTPVLCANLSSETGSASKPSQESALVHRNTTIHAAFEEQRIWEHFERLPGDFWVFVERAF